MDLVNKNSAHLQGINQDFKEKEVAKRAEELGISYVNLLQSHLNPDVLDLLPEEQSKNANLVVFFQIGKKLRIALSEPENFFAKQIIQNFKNENYAVNINLASDESIKHIQSFYQQKNLKKNEMQEVKVEEEEQIATKALEEFEEKQETIQTETANDALGEFHGLAIKMHASDVHFQPEEKEVLVRFRVDGILQTVSRIPHNTYAGLVKQIKFQSHLKLNISNQSQDGQYFFEVNNRSVDVRVSSVPSIYGETLVLRLLDPKKGIVPLSELGFKRYALEKIANALTKPEGMILLTGPTGSGKTTTLYSLLDVLNRPYRKIITLEDPVEYKLAGIVQCEVSRNEEQETFSFQDGLVAALRQDPDVIMVGEIREGKVANTAVQAAMTGHMVLSTLHTNSAIDTISRLLNLSVSEYTLAPSLNTVIAQRLVRKVCPHCSTQRHWNLKTKEVLEKSFSLFQSLGMENLVFPEFETFGKGCDYCNNSGFLGRVTVAEVFPISEKIRSLILEKSDKETLLQQAKQEGFVSMKEDAFLKVILNETTFDEVLRVLG